ncbi:MAG: ABC transporter permease subunit [Planctomycetota bacterium]|nr:ABC transporter permease subunit [Planctomycetota bacterium]
MRSKRSRIILSIIAIAAAAYLHLGASVGDLIPKQQGANIVIEFAKAGLTPEASLQNMLSALGVTIKYALAAMSLAFLFALPFSVIASHSFWVQRGFAPHALRWLVRSFIAAMRSVHELLWAALLLAAMGLSPISAVIAIAIPYAGTLAKVFADIIDEAPRRSEAALTSIGASRWQRFFFGRLPQAIPDMLSYAFYRFECALRSSAILGFFGFPTLGYYIKLEFDNLNYSKVWAYLYVLLAMVVAVEYYSMQLRRRFVA